MPEEKFNKSEYVRPTLDLLNDGPDGIEINGEEVERCTRAILRVFEKHNLPCNIFNIAVGPSITRYDVKPDDNQNIRQALRYSDELAVELCSYNVLLYINYPKGCISVEVPNGKKTQVGIRSLISSPEFATGKPASLKFVLGKDVDGNAICPDIATMPHLLVAGTTGTGKSMCLNSLLISLLYGHGPEELRLILIDTKQVEYTQFRGLPHLLTDIICDVDSCIKALNWAIREMEHRYTLFKQMTESGKITYNIESYNNNLPRTEQKLPYIVIVIDELGDLMLQEKREIENRIVRLVQKSRACGIHLVVATQRPSVDVITGVIKCNIPTRIAFKLNSRVDSVNVLDCEGAERLLGRGDLYFRTCEAPEPRRIQGCCINSCEVQSVTDFIRANNPAGGDSELTEYIKTTEIFSVTGHGKIDDIFLQALKLCIDAKQASVSFIQRRLPVGYIKASKIIDWMENMNYITPSEGAKPRTVLLSAQEFENIYGGVHVDDDPVAEAIENILRGRSALFAKTDDSVDAEQCSDKGEIDELYLKALKYCILTKAASVSMLQRSFPIGYIKACKIIDWMEAMNYVAPQDGAKPRKVLLTLEEFIKIYGDIGEE